MEHRVNICMLYAPTAIFFLLTGPFDYDPVPPFGACGPAQS